MPVLGAPESAPSLRFHRVCLCRALTLEASHPPRHMLNQLGLGAAPRPKSGLKRTQHRFIVSVLIPIFVFYAVYRFFPVGYAFWLSLTDWQLLRDEYSFRGLQNYQQALQDPVFRLSIVNAFYYALGATLGGVTVSLLLTLVINPIRYGSLVFRLIYFLPQMTSGVAILLVWRWLLQARFGLVNQGLVALGLERLNFLGSTTLVMPTLIVMAIWGGLGFTMVILLAGLRGIPIEFYEAARMDGGSRWHLARFITIPLMKPVLTFVTVTGIIGGFNVFGVIYILTRGGPLNSSMTISYYIYKHAFEFRFIGLASAMAFVMFAIIIVLTILQLRLTRENWEF